MTLSTRTGAGLVALAGWLLALLLAPAAHAQDSWTGDWHGTLATPGGELRLRLTIRQSEDGALAADLESLDQAPGQKIPVSEISIEDGQLAFVIAAIGASYEGRWQPQDGRFVGTFVQGMRLPLTFARGGGQASPVVSGLDGVWRGHVTRNDVRLRLVLRIATGDRGTSATLGSPEMYAIAPVSGLARDGDSVSFAVPLVGVRYSGTLVGERITGTWSREDAADQTVEFVRSGSDPETVARPQLPRPPFPYRVEEVRFANPEAPEITLAGTLTLPEDGGPFAAAILISGSGPHDRDEEIIPGHKPFAVLADHLTRAGIAVLRYDDRGVAGSSGTHAGATSADFATDANAAFAFLSRRDDVDPRAIGFIGHSEGGIIAPLAALENEDLAYLVLLAAPGTRTEPLLDAQLRAIGPSQGATAAELERQALNQALMLAAAAADGTAAEIEARLRADLTDDRLRAAGLPPGWREVIVARATDPWWRYFARYDPAPVLARIRIPVLAINGSLDRQVVARENLEGIAAALRHAPDVTVRELSGLNHMFQTAPTGTPGEYGDIEETFAPAALELVSGWITQRFPDHRAPSPPPRTARALPPPGPDPR